MIVCEKCQGTGRKVTYNDESLAKDGILFETVECEVCNGSGLVDEHFYQWYNEMLGVIENQLGRHEKF